MTGPDEPPLNAWARRIYPGTMAGNSPTAMTPTPTAKSAWKIIEDYFEAVFQSENPKILAKDLEAILSTRGFKIIARESTEAITDAIMAASERGGSAKDIFRAMWDAAP